MDLGRNYVVCPHCGKRTRGVKIIIQEGLKIICCGECSAVWSVVKA